MANPIGISYPIRRGTKGYFEQSFETKQTIKDALANLVLTPKKSRPGRPEYGSSLYDLLFEPIEDSSVVQSVLEEDISKWIPSINIISITAKSSTYPNSIDLEIKYNIRNTPIEDELIITVSP